MNNTQPKTIEERLKTIFIDNNVIFSTGDERRCVEDIKDFIKSERELLAEKIEKDTTPTHIIIVGGSTYIKKDVVIKMMQGK